MWEGGRPNFLGDVKVSLKSKDKRNDASSPSWAQAAPEATAEWGPKFVKMGKKLAKDEDNSVLWLHSLHHHQGREDVNYTMKVTETYNEPLDRQVMERVQISNFKGPVLMNRKN